MEFGLVVIWLVAYGALGAIALPLSAFVCPRFVDRGAGIAIPLALLVLGMVAFWVGRLSFGWFTIVAGIAVLGAGSAVAVRRGVVVDWRAYAEIVVVFAVAFALFVGIRAVDPGLPPWGGEKFLDYGLLNTHYRASSLPAEDVWFAGERVKYYYGGHMLAALLGTLTLTPPHYAYNLALAGAYATLVATAYGVAGPIAADRGYPRVAAAATAAFFVGIASNLTTPVRFVSWVVPGGLRLAEFAGVDRRGGDPTLTYGPDSFDYWDASRVIDGTINEFPFFAFLNGDLHAHMMGTPFLLLTVAVLYSYWYTSASAVQRRRALVFGLVPALAAWLAVVNTWDAPTVVGLTAIALLFAPSTPISLLPAEVRRVVDGLVEERASWVGSEGKRLFGVTLAVGVLALVAIVLALPFVLGATTTGGRSVELVEDRSGLAGPLLVHGAFLLVSAWYVLDRVDTSAIVDRTIVLVCLLVALAWFAGAITVLLFVPFVLAGWLLRRRSLAGFEMVLLVAATGLALLVEVVYLSEPAGPGRLNTVFKVYMQVWVLWSVATGVMLAGLLAGPPSRGGSPVADGQGTRSKLDPDRSERDVVERTSGGAPASTTGDVVTPYADVPAAAVGSKAQSAKGGRVPPLVWSRVLVAAVLVVSLSLYSGLALADHVDGTDGTSLDARAFAVERSPAEAAAIDWLAAREGQPRIVEGARPGYDYGLGNPLPPSHLVNAPSSHSGLPTIVGWGHQADYHGRDQYDQRIGHVETIYEGSAVERAELLRAYDVEYVYVGPNEHTWFSVRPFDADPGIEVAESYGSVTIYRVDQDRLLG